MKSQKEMVLEHLEERGSITPRDADDAFGIMRLSAIIFDLRAEGYDIRTETETKNNRFGRPTSYARYIYEPKPVQMAMEV